MAKLNLHDKAINMMCEIRAAKESGNDKQIDKTMKKAVKLANEIVSEFEKADHPFKQIVLSSLHRSLMQSIATVAEIF
jgi:hypothetical protein